MRFQTLLQWTASISGSLSLLGSGYVLHDLRAKRRANDGVLSVGEQLAAALSPIFSSAASEGINDLQDVAISLQHFVAHADIPMLDHLIQVGVLLSKVNVHVAKDYCT